MQSILWINTTDHKEEEQLEDRKKLWREQLWLWRRNGSKGPILDVYDDDDKKETCRKSEPPKLQ